jgi:hypothetical protein
MQVYLEIHPSRKQTNEKTIRETPIPRKECVTRNKGMKHCTEDGAGFFGMLSTGFLAAAAPVPVPDGLAAPAFLSCGFMNHFLMSDDCATRKARRAGKKRSGE